MKFAQYKNMKNRTLIKNLTFIIPIFLIIILSLLNMYGASFISSLYKTAFKRQILWVLIGIVACVLLNIIDKRFLFKKITIIYILDIILLILVLFLGINVNGASSWFKLGPISIQPSEIFKPFFIVFLANLVSNHNGKSIILLIKIIIFTFIPTILIFLEPDTGVVIMYLLIMVGAIIASPIKKWQFMLFGLAILLLLVGFLSLYFFNKDLFIKIFGTSFFYRMDRLIDYKNNSSYQLNNALIGIGSAGMFGYGLTHSKIYVPEIITDFAFDLTVMNFGYVIGIILIMLYVYLLHSIYKAYKNTNKLNDKIVLMSIFSLMLFQVFEHIFMNLGLTPITGITLPFLSYGGSSLLSYFLILSLILKCD